MAGLFDNIFTGNGGGLLSALMGNQPIGVQQFSPYAAQNITALPEWLKALDGRKIAPGFYNPSNPSFGQVRNPSFGDPLGIGGTNNVNAGQLPLDESAGLDMRPPGAGNESAGLNMNPIQPSTEIAQPQPVDPWAGIRGVNEQPPALGNNQSMLSQGAQPTQVLTNQAINPSASPMPDFADRLGAGFMGFTNSRSPMQAIGNLVSGLATGQRSDPSGMALQQQRATYNALVARGVPQADAMAATLNPDIMKIVGAKYFDTQAKLQETGTDPLTGQKSFAEYRPGQGLTPVATNGNQTGAAPSFFANGVTGINRNLVGDDYLAQFSPEVQAAVKAYMRGDSMPTGNPRLAGGIGAIKQIAQKYSEDVGTPVSDALYSQRRTYRSQLGSNSPSSAGGQAKSFNQGIEHLSALADTLVKLDNSNGLGIPSIASGVNSIRQGFSNDQAAIADNASNIGQALAGEIGKLFSGSSGGGVHERQLTMERFNTVKSKPQLAAALEATLELMHGGLTALEQRRDEVLGPNSDVRFVTEKTQEKIQHIQEVIDRLKGRNTKSAPSANQADPLGIR